MPELSDGAVVAVLGAIVVGAAVLATVLWRSVDRDRRPATNTGGGGGIGQALGRVVLTLLLAIGLVVCAVQPAFASRLFAYFLGVAALVVAAAFGRAWWRTRHFTRARRLAERGDVDGAIFHLRDRVDDAAAREDAVAILLATFGRYPEALAAARAAYEANAEIGRSTEGAILLGMGRTDRAIELLAEELTKRADDFVTRSNYALALTQAGRQRDAAAELERLRAQHDELPTVPRRAHRERTRILEAVETAFADAATGD